MNIKNNRKELRDVVESYRATGQSIGLCHGCFDIIHPGHIYHLKQANAGVDRLIVSITADKFVNKGKDRPVFSAQKRAEVMASIRYCDVVFINHGDTAEQLIELVEPELFFKGPDYKTGHDPRVSAEKSLVEKHGGQLKFTDKNIFDSTSRIAQLLMSGG